MVYRIYDDETDMLLTRYPLFESLDDQEEYLDNIAEAWDVIEATEEETVYEIIFNEEEIIYLAAILVA